jgi:transcriptional regulator with XRE-family HTH domain
MKFTPIPRWDQKAKMLVDARQIKAARSLLRWKQDQLAQLTGLALSTIRRLERSEGRIEANFDTVEKIRQALENAGIEFIGSPNLGVRFWVQPEAAASPSQNGEAALAPARTGQAYGRVVG